MYKLNIRSSLKLPQNEYFSQDIFREVILERLLVLKERLTHFLTKTQPMIRILAALGNESVSVYLPRNRNPGLHIDFGAEHRQRPHRFHSSNCHQTRKGKFFFNWRKKD